MTATESEATEYILNYFEKSLPPPNNLPYVTANQRSPSPSGLSENSVECGGVRQQQMSSDIEMDSSDDNNNSNIINNNRNSGDNENDCEDLEDSEQELTSLMWLTQLKNLAAWPESVNPILDDDLCEESKTGQGGTTNGKKDSVAVRFNRFVDQVNKNRDSYNVSAQLFQSDTDKKPPFNYAQIIAMAMLDNGRMTLQQICAWIEAKFAYYRVRKNWNNSIRHNLSLQFCFRKINRNKYEKGKGGYWELGIDANKMERKRIRNRKTRSLQSNQSESLPANENLIKISQVSRNKFNVGKSSGLESELFGLVTEGSSDMDSSSKDDTSTQETIDEFNTSYRSWSADVDDFIYDPQRQTMIIDTDIQNINNSQDIQQQHQHNHQTQNDFVHDSYPSGSHAPVHHVQHVANFETIGMDNEIVVTSSSSSHTQVSGTAAVMTSTLISPATVLSHVISSADANSSTTMPSLSAAIAGKLDVRRGQTVLSGLISDASTISGTAAAPLTSTAPVIVSGVVNGGVVVDTTLNKVVMSSTCSLFEEEFSSAGGTMVDPTTMEAQTNACGGGNINEHIFLASEVPQPIENIVISVLNNYPNDGPNVIVEHLPYALPMDDGSFKSCFDGIDAEFQFLKDFENRDDLIDPYDDISTQDF